MNEDIAIELNRQGDDYYNNKEYEKAIIEYTKAIELDPKYVEAYNSRGNAYCVQEEYEKAIIDYEKVIELDQKYLDVYYGMGTVYRNQGEHEKAIAEYGKAMKIDLKYVKAYYGRGSVYYYQGEYEKAIEEYTKAIELDSNYVNSYCGRGNVYYNQGEYEKAKKDYTKAIELDPKCVYAYSGRGVAYYYQDEYEKAIEDFTKAIELDPKCVYAYNARGNVYYKQEKYEKAVEEYEKAMELDSKYVNAYNGRGNVYYNQEEYEKAIEDYTKAIELDSKFRIGYANRGVAYNNFGKYEEGKRDSYIIEIVFNLKEERFFEYIDKAIPSIEIQNNIYELFVEVMKLKKKLLYEEKTLVGHYTKINNLKHLVKPRYDKNKKEKNRKGIDEKSARLRLNNVSYMNDPTEGEVFLNLLKKAMDFDSQSLLDSLYNNQDKYNSKREVLNGKNHVFLVSFSKAIDTSLPMWVQYSANGEGACLVLDPLFFDDEDKDCFSHITSDEKMYEGSINDVMNSVKTEKNKKIYYCLYKVKYVNENKIENDEEINNLILSIGEKLDNFEENIKNNEPTMKTILQNILDQVRFLFKDKDYSYEEEVRLVKFEDNGNVKYTDDTEGFRVPHVYIELDKELEFEEVVLGPKVQNAMEIANYLYYTDKVKEVSKSKIKYK